MNSYQPNPSRSAPLGGAQNNFAHSNSFYSLVNQWEKEAPSGENRSRVALQIKDVFKRNAPDVLIELCNISTLPPIPKSVTKLKLFGLGKLQTLNKDLSQLSELTIMSCGITSLPDNLTNLTFLSLGHCEGVEEVPPGISGLTSLILFSCDGINALVLNQPSLKSVRIVKCQNLASWSGNLPSLSEAVISDCRKLTTWSCSVSQLKILDLEKCPDLSDYPEDLPVDLNYSTKSRCEQKVAQQLLSTFSCEQLNALCPLSNKREISAYKQLFLKSCGAASLLAIARELGSRRFSVVAQVLPQFPAMTDVYLCLDENANWKLLKEEDLYRATSGFNGVVEDINSAGGSLPHKICKEASSLGLDFQVYVEPGMYIDRESSNPDVQNTLGQLTLNRIDIGEKQPPLNANELEMQVILMYETGRGLVSKKWDEAAHWIVVRPDGTIMDPANGKNFNTFDELRNFCYQSLGSRIEPAGMSIVFKRGSQQIQI